MIQENFKTQIEAIQTASQKVKATVGLQVAKAEEETLRLLAELAGGEIEENSKLSDIVAKIRENNPSFKQFLLNLDAATYDSRKQLKWNTSMMAAYAKLQAEKSIEKDIKPAVDAYLSEAENKLKTLANKANEVKAKVLN